MRSGLNLRIAHKGVILVAVPLILELVFIAILSILLRQTEVEVQRQLHARAIITKAGVLAKLYRDAGLLLSTYNMTRDPHAHDRYEETVQQIPGALNEMSSIAGSNAARTEGLQALVSDNEAILKVFSETRKLIEAKHVLSQAEGNKIDSLTAQLNTDLHNLTQDENRIKNMTPEAQNRSRSMVQYYLLVGVIFNVLLAFGLAAFFSRGITVRLRVLTDNTMRLARGDPLNPPLGGGDEIAMLDETFHSMADALMEGSRKERAIIENAVDVICSIDANGNFTAVSPASRNIWDYEPDELVGRRFIELILPADHDETIRCVRAVRHERGTMSFENRLRRKDGSLITILWSTFWSESERSMFCVAHDITQRKLAEETLKSSERRLRNVIEHMTGGLVTITPDGIIESINPASERMFGYAAAELVGQHIATIFEHDNALSVENDAHRRKITESLIDRTHNETAKVNGRNKTGELFSMQLSIGDLETPDGPRFLASILDLSE